MPGGSVGTIYYDVLPDLSGFGAAVAAATGNFKPAQVKVSADTRQAQAGITALTGATGQLTGSSTKLANAQGQLRVANARLAETSQKAAAGSARLLSAQESQARAMRSVVAAQREVQASAEAARRPAEKLYKTLGAKINDGGVQRLATGVTAAGAALGLGVGLAVKTTADFEQAVSHVASTGDEAKKRISELRAEAVKFGADTAYSATEAANAQQELIKANVSVADTINGGLAGALDLAAAGSLGVADAAGIMATAMSQFKIEGDQASHVADLLAAGAGKAQGEVSDFAGALKYVGPNAKAMGVSIEETVGVLAMFADQGVLGEQAGTSFRSMLVSLSAPMGAGAKEIQKYGINLRDASGEFIGMEGAAEQLRKKLGGLSRADRDAALARIFGKNSLTAATILYEGGAEGVAKWTKAVNDSGYAQDVAREKMNNLRGDVEKLGGAIQSAFIGAASSSTSPLRGIVQNVTNVVDAVGELPAAVQGGLFKGTAAVAATAVFAGGLVKVAGAAKEAKVALDVLKVSSKTALLGAGALGIGLTVAAVAVGHWAGESAKAKQATDNLSEALVASNGVVDESIAKMRAKELVDSGAIGQARKLGISVEDLTAASLGNVAAQERVNAVLSTTERQSGNVARGMGDVTGKGVELGKAADAVQDALDKGNKTLKDAQGEYSDYSRSVDAGTAAVGQSEEAHRKNQDAIGRSLTALQQLGTASSRTAEESQRFASQLFKEGETLQAVTTSYSSYQAAIDTSAASIKGQSLSIEKGTGLLRADTDVRRDAVGALTGLASAGKSYVTSMAAQGASSRDLQEATKGVRDDFIAAAREGGLTAKAARNLADDYGLVPKEVKTTFDAVGIAAQQAKIKEYQEAIEGLTQPQRIRLESILDKKGSEAAEKYLKSLVADPYTFKLKADTKQAKQNAVDLRVTVGKVPSDKTTLFKTPGVNTAQREVRTLDGQIRNTPKSLTTRTSAPGAKGAAGDIRTLDDRINDVNGKNVAVNVGINFSQNKLAVDLVKKYGKSARIPSAYAKGGKVQNLSGLGERSYDTEPAMLRVNEHVWTPEEVRGAGGHEAMYRARAAAKKGELHFARGGAVARRLEVGVDVDKVPSAGSFNNIPTLGERLGSQAASGYASALSNAYRGILKKAQAAAEDGGGGLIGGKGFANGLAFARSQVGKPYRWASAGPGGYDCSGFMAAIANVVQGKRPYVRRFSTGQAAGGPKTVGGFTRGKSSAFRIGINPTRGSKIGHTAGTINGVNVESAGGVGVRVGKSARGANSGMFPLHYGLAKGGPVLPKQGDPPYDTLSKTGQRFTPGLEELAEKFYGQKLYDQGGVLAPGATLAVNKTGKPEYTFENSQFKALNRVVKSLESAIDVKSGRPTRSPVPVIINIHGGDMREVRRTVEDVLAEHGEYDATINRMRR
jgi:TP901 family phage tail tape measure protein